MERSTSGSPSARKRRSTRRLNGRPDGVRIRHKDNGKRHLTWTRWARARVRKGEKEERHGEKEMEVRDQTPRAEARAMEPGHH